MSILIQILAYVLMFAAADVGRKEESEVEMFSWKWMLQVFLFATAGFILSVFNGN